MTDTIDRSMIQDARAALRQCSAATMACSCDLFARRQARASDGDVAAAVAALASARDAELAARRALKDRIRDVVDAKGALPALDGGVPIVLFPVWLETKFVGDQLRIRIHPDDVLVDAHEAQLTADETAAGRAFWTSWRASVSAGDSSVPTRDVLFATVLRTVSPKRAAYVVSTTRPTNFDGTDPLVFPQVDARPQPWSREARIELLPDRFFVQAFRDGKLVVEAQSELVDPVIVASPSPLEPRAPAQAQIRTQSGTGTPLTGPFMEPALRWLIDFDAAVAVGLGVVLPLTATDQQKGFDQIIAFGVKASLGPSESASALETLFGAHHFTDGIEVLAPGTPTNNSSIDGAAYPPPPLALADVRLGEALPVAPAESLVAKVFGVAADLGCGAVLRGRNDDSVQQAADMAAALYPATLGYFFAEAFEPLISQSQIDLVEAFFKLHVRPGGHYPALRIGAAPYGVLPVTLLPGSTGADPGPELPFEQSMHQFAAKVLPHVDAEVAKLPYVGSPAGTTKDTVLDILGRTPSAAYQQIKEYYVDPESARMLGCASFVQPYTLVGPTAEGLQVANWYTSGSTIFAGGVDDPARVPYVATVDDISQRDEVPGRFKSHYNYRLGWDVSKSPLAGPLPDAARAAVAAWDLTQRLPWNDWDDGNGALLLRLFQQSALVSRLQWIAKQTIPPQFSKYTLDPKAGKDSKGWELSDRLSQIIPLLAGNGFGNTSDLAKVPPDLAALFTKLLALDVKTLHRLLGETLDACSHRVDAWLGGLAKAELDRRLEALDGTSGHRYIGAFGWAERVTPTTKLEHQGYALAPSLGHAATAGVLYSAYAAQGGGVASPYAVDLSSARVRDAITVLDSMRAGQRLAEVLGSQVESALHDAKLDKFLAPLRKLYPLEGSSTADDPGVAAAVDGLKVMKAMTGKIETVIDTIDAIETVSAADLLQLETILAIPDQKVDATSDLLLAESVHRLTHGDFSGAGATLDTITAGGAPPELRFVRSATSGSLIVHRFGVRMPAAASEGQGARETLSPALAAWVAAVLGDLARVTCTLTDAASTKEVRASDLGLEPLALVELAANVEPAAFATPASPDASRPLHRLIAKAAGAGPSGSIADTGAAGTERFRSLVTRARSVAALLGDARSLIPGDFAGAADTPAVDVDAPPGQRMQLQGIATKLADDAAKTPATPAELVAQLDALAEVLVEAAGFTAAYPDLATTAARCAAAASGRAAAATQALATKLTLSQLQEVARELLGPSTVLLVSVTPPATWDASRVGARVPSDGQLATQIRTWREQLRLVRPVMARWNTLATFARLRAGKQFTYQAFQDPPAIIETIDQTTASVERWLGFAAPPARLARSLVCTSLAPIDAPDWLGLVVDSWTETVPGNAVDAGLAIHYDNPGAEAPQAILVAVPPHGTQAWDADMLRAILQDTLRLAKMRLVDSLPDLFPLPALFLPQIAEDVWDFDPWSVGGQGNEWSDWMPNWHWYAP